MADVETPTEVRATAKYVRTAPRKAQLVVAEIRGRRAVEARQILAFMTRDAARDVDKVLASADRERRGQPRPLGTTSSTCPPREIGSGPDAEALARPRARTRRADQEAHLPHHDPPRAGRGGRPGATRPGGRGEAQGPEPRAPAEGRGHGRDAGGSGARGRRAGAPRRSRSGLAARSRRAGSGPRGGGRGGAEAQPAPAPSRLPRQRRRRRSRSGRPARRPSRSPRRRASGTEGSSGRSSRRDHPRLEVELVHEREGVPALPDGGRARSAITSSGSSPTPASRTS